MPDLDDLDYRFLYIQKAYETGRINGLYYGPDGDSFTTLQEFLEDSGAVYIEPDDAIAAMGDEPLRDVFLYRSLNKVLAARNEVWRPQFQKRGTCVGQASKIAQDDFMALNHLEFGEDFEGRACVAYNYAGGRVEKAGQPGRWDGSNSDWSLGFLLSFGRLLLKDLGLPEDSRDEDEQFAVSWANSREGVPSQFETMGKRRKSIKSFTRVRSYEECHRYIQSGHSIVNDSNTWANGRRDNDGFSPVSPQRGGHAECYRGARVSGRRGLLQQNSWSERWGTGGRPFPEDMPDGSVWEDERAVDARCRQNGTFVIFPDVEPKPRELDYSFFRKKVPSR